jgi:hypothetical protein
MAPGESSGVGTDPQQVTVVRSRRPSRLTTVCSTCLGVKSRDVVYDVVV